MAAQAGDGAGPEAQLGAQENHRPPAQLAANAAAPPQANRAPLGVANIVANVALADGDNNAAAVQRNGAAVLVGAVLGHGPVAAVAPARVAAVVADPVEPNMVGVGTFNVDAAVAGPLPTKSNFFKDYEVYPAVD